MDNSNNLLLKKVNTADGSVTTVETRGGVDQAQIWRGYYDQSSGIIYFIDNGIVDKFVMWKIDTSDDTVTELGNLDIHGLYYTEGDIFYINSNLYVFVGFWSEDPDDLEGDIELRCYKWSTPSTWTDVNSITYAAGADEITRWAQNYTVATSSTIAYMFIEFRNATLGTYDIYAVKFDASTDTLSNDATFADSDYRISELSEILLSTAYDDSDYIYLILYDTNDSLNYLFIYDITDNSLTQKEERNVSLMLDRNTDTTNNEPFNLEKGFAISLDSDYKGLIYQISRNRGALNFLGSITLSSGDSIIAITDTYLIINDGGTIEIWEFQDIISDLIAEGKIYTEVRKWAEATLIQLKKSSDTYQDPPRQNQFIQIFGRWSSYTIGGSYYSDNVVLFEGLVRFINKDIDQEVTIKSLIKEELENVSPSISDYTNYTGKTSGQIISQLITDYCTHISAGTISNGTTTWTCPSDWRAEGDKALMDIFNELADTEYFQWYLHPNGSLDFNDGTVNSQRTFATTDSYGNPYAELVSQQTNRIELMGGFVNGVQIGPVYANDLVHQQLYGNIITWSKTYASVLDATILQTLADNKLSLQGESPLMYYADRQSSDWGLLQVGELVALQALKFSERSDETVTAGNYILIRNTLDIKNQTSDLKFSDGMLWQEDSTLNLPVQNSQAIVQVANTAADVITRIPRISSNLASIEYFYGSAGFNYETVGTTGTDIEWVTTNTINTCVISSEIGDHKNVLTLTATASSNMQSTYVSGDTGTWEGWLRVAQSNIIINFGIYDGGEANSIHLVFWNDGNLYYYDGAFPGSTHIIQAYSADTWYHFKIEWDCSTDWHLWIDGVSQDGGGGYSFEGSPTNMDQFIINPTGNSSIYLDASGLVGETDPQGYTYLEGGNYNYSEVEKAHGAINVKNRDTMACILEGSNDNAFHQLTTSATYSNVGADDFTLTFAIPLPVTKGTKSLYIDAIIIGVEDADAGDYIDNAYLKKWTAYGTSSTEQTDATNRTSAAEVEFSFTAEDLSDAKRVVVQVDVVATDANDLDISYVLVQYYYDD